MRNTLLHASIAALMLGQISGCGSAPTPSAAPADAAMSAQAATLSRRLVVGFRSAPDRRTLAELEQAHGLKLVKELRKVAIAVFEASGAVKAAEKALTTTPNVEFVETERLPEREPLRVENVDAPTLQDGGDPLRDQQYYLDLMGVPKVWLEAKRLKPVTVAVVDSGVDLTHPDLQGVLVPGHNVPDPSKPPQDDLGHGTMCAGLIAAVANNGVGIAGIAPNAKIMPVRYGSSSSDMVEAMIYAADHADVVSMSLSLKPLMPSYWTHFKTMKRGAAYVVGKGVPLVCSMGNTGPMPLQNIPAFFAGKDVPQLIAVGATDQRDRPAGFATHGSWMTVVAPGDKIVTTKRGGKWGVTQGTSFSTPLTAGVVAMMIGAGHPSDPAAIKATLQATALDIGPAGFDKKSGAGRVDAFRAVVR